MSIGATDPRSFEAGKLRERLTDAALTSTSFAKQRCMQAHELQCGPFPTGLAADWRDSCADRIVMLKRAR